jgi:transcriptional regulator with GAF, ATPase, and Fis domain
MLAVIHGTKTESGYSAYIDLDELLQPYQGNEEGCNGFEGVVGSSRAFRGVLDQIRAVAPTHSTAPRRGDGHRQRGRRDCNSRTQQPPQSPLRPVECAAILLGLLESEFGHEKVPLRAL